MKSIGVYLLSVLLMATLLSACLINERPMVTLKLDVGCEEYVWDGETEDGEWTSGHGTTISLDGSIRYNSFTASELRNVVAKFTSYDVSGLRIDVEIPIPLNSSGTAVIKKAFDFEDSFYCSEQKYSVSFYSSGGASVPHKGDFENSINHPLYSDDLPTPDQTREAVTDAVLTAIWQTMEATYATPSP